MENQKPRNLIVISALVALVFGRLLVTADAALHERWWRGAGPGFGDVLRLLLDDGVSSAHRVSQPQGDARGEER